MDIRMVKPDSLKIVIFFNKFENLQRFFLKGKENKHKIVHLIQTIHVTK